MTTPTQLAERQSATIDSALEALSDSRLTTEDKAGAYALLHQVQLRINRALRKVKDDLIIYMESNGLKQLGPLSVKRTAIDVEWPVNAEGNWGDHTTQDAIRTLILPIAPELVRHVPEHYELRTAELGAAVHLGDPVALEVWRQAKAHGWRKEAGKRLSIEVKEAK
jgi:hypothetical protein